MHILTDVLRLRSDYVHLHAMHYYYGLLPSVSSN